MAISIDVLTWNYRQLETTGRCRISLPGNEPLYWLSNADLSALKQYTQTAKTGSRGYIYVIVHIYTYVHPCVTMIIKIKIKEAINFRVGKHGGWERGHLGGPGGRMEIEGTNVM